jgi:hypothetical protein
MLAGALAVAAFPPVGLTAVATAQPRTWDIDLYDQCLEVYAPASNYTILEWVEVQHTCCDASDGVWDEWHGVCSSSIRRCAGLTAASGQRADSIRYCHRADGD